MKPLNSFLLIHSVKVCLLHLFVNESFIVLVIEDSEAKKKEKKRKISPIAVDHNWSGVANQRSILFSLLCTVGNILDSLQK